MKDSSCRILINCQTTQTDTSTSPTLTKAGLKVSGVGRPFLLLSVLTQTDTTTTSATKAGLMGILVWRLWT